MLTPKRIADPVLSHDATAGRGRLGQNVWRFGQPLALALLPILLDQLPVKLDRLLKVRIGIRLFCQWPPPLIAINPKHFRSDLSQLSGFWWVRLSHGVLPSFCPSAPVSVTNRAPPVRSGAVSTGWRPSG